MSELGIREAIAAQEEHIKRTMSCRGLAGTPHKWRPFGDPTKKTRFQACVVCDVTQTSVDYEIRMAGAPLAMELMYKMANGSSVRVSRVPPVAPATVATYGIRYAHNGEPIGYPLVTEAANLIEWIENATGYKVTGAVDGHSVVPIGKVKA